ncbi:FkbM family methyltransferase, partial [Methanocella conradii]|uniref:FkbM family methyltransferase n=1 Tax=Methanocella conradii TaxID=1175444 RepID=UPI0024B383C2
MKLYGMQLMEIAPLKRNFKMLVTPEVYSNYNNETYDRFSLELLEHHMHEGTLFIDVGAHYGYYSLVVGTKYPNNRIIAFEPSPQNYEILKYNVEQNGLKNIKLYSLAVSDKDEERDFLIAEHSDNCGFYDHPLTRMVGKVKVKTIALDTLINDVPESHVIIKIDVEGHEISALNGMANLLKRIENVELFVEFNPKMIQKSGRKPEDLLRLIDRMGFDIFFIEDDKRETYKIRDPNDWNSYFAYKSSTKSYYNMLCIKKNRSLSLCIFSHSSQLEGAERGLLELTTELIRDYGALCTVILPNVGPLKERLENVGASILLINYSWWCDWTFPDGDKINLAFNNSFSALSSQMKQLELINPDIILTNTIVIPWGAIAAMNMNKPHVWYVREFGKIDHGLKFYKPFQEIIRIIEASNLIITNSNAVKKALFENVKENIVTIYNYIYIPPEALLCDCESPFTRENATKLIIMGRIDEPKGQEDIVLAVKELVSRKKDVELVMMGTHNPGYMEMLKALIADNSLEPYVKFVGFNANPYPVLNKADIVILCSRNEAFGRVIVEAMLLKKPVIGTNSGGVPEIIKEGYNGLLYEPGNASELADKIEYLIENKDKIVEMGEKGYKFVKENFTEEKYGGEIYRRLKSLKNAANNASPSLFNFMANIMNNAIKQKDEKINHLEATLQSKDQEIKQKDEKINHLEATLQSKD